MKNNTLTSLEIATDYRRRGWQPIPIAHREKNPNFTDWQNLSLNDLDLPKHFNGKPQNIGVLLGTKSNGLTDIDLDSPEAVKIADYFLPTTKSEFGRAGKPRSHRLYISNFPKTEKFEFGEMIVEIRSTGGQTVFPGSTHKGGESIQWASDGEPLKIDAQLLRRAVALLASAALISTFWRSGIRNELNLALSGALLRNGFDLAETKLFVRAIGVAANDEEISDRLKTIDATSQKLQNGEKVCGFPRLAELTDKKLVEAVCKWLGINHKQEKQIKVSNHACTISEFTGEPKPLDLVLKPVETIDDDCLPKVLVDWLRPAAKVIGCPFDFLVLSAIVTAGSLIGSRVRVKALQNSDWFVVPNIYAGLVGLPSTKKTPALDETRKPILELQCKAREKYLSERKEFEVENKFYEKESARILKESKTRDDYKRRLLELEETKTSPPILRRFETNDITTPKLIEFLAENPNGLSLFRDELTGWLNSLEAEYDKSARAFFLELWKGAVAYELARMDGRETHLTSGTLSIIGGVQPSKLQKYVSEAYSFDISDGFLQRFAFAYPDISRQPEKPTESDYLAMKKGYAIANETFEELTKYNFNGRVIGANGDCFKAVKFASDAQKSIDEWKDETEGEAERLQIEDEAFSSYLYKLPKNCFAVALIFHCLENVNQTCFPDEITAVTALRAITYIDILKSHARRVFALGENQTFALAQILIGKIKKGDLEQGFKARDIVRKQWSGFKSKDVIQGVLDLLVDYNYLRENQTEGEGRRTIIYFIHPSLDSEVKDEMEK